MWSAAANTCWRPESSSVCEAGTERGLQHLPPMWAQGIGPISIGFVFKHTKEAAPIRPVIGHAQTVPGIIVANIANSARMEKGIRSHAFIEVGTTNGSESRSTGILFQLFSSGIFQASSWILYPSHREHPKRKEHSDKKIGQK